MTIGPLPQRSARWRPVWIASPGRATGLGRGQARAALAIIVLVMASALAMSRGVGGDPIDGSAGPALLDAVRHGANFYSALPMTDQVARVAAPGWTTPLPTLVLIEALIPRWCASAAMMLMAVAVVVGWYARFGAHLATPAARTAALLLMLAGLAVALRLPLVAVAEGWAGLLVAMSLARSLPGRVVEAAALGLSAAALSCAALPYLAMMALSAAVERAWRDSLIWALTLAVGLALALLHGHALAPALGGDARVAMLTPGAALAALASATGLRLLPLGVALPLVMLATIGWASRCEPVAVRVAVLIVVQAAVVALLDLPAAALIVAPLLPLGLVAVPDAIRDLAAAALGRRRITVTRLVR